MTFPWSAKSALTTIAGTNPNAPRYKAGTTQAFSGIGAGSIFFAFTGSATKLVVLKRILVSGVTASAVAASVIVVRKISTAPTGGTVGLTLTKGQIDSNDPDSTVSLCQTYSVAPSGGANALNTLASRRILVPTAIAGSILYDADVDFEKDMADTPYRGVPLRGVNQGIVIVPSSVDVSGMSIELEWTEE